MTALMNPLIFLEKLTFLFLNLHFRTLGFTGIYKPKPPWGEFCQAKNLHAYPLRLLPPPPTIPPSPICRRAYNVKYYIINIFSSSGQLRDSINLLGTTMSNQPPMALCDHTCNNTETWTKNLKECLHTSCMMGFIIKLLIYEPLTCHS